MHGRALLAGDRLGGIHLGTVAEPTYGCNPHGFCLLSRQSLPCVF